MKNYNPPLTEQEKATCKKINQFFRRKGYSFNGKKIPNYMIRKSRSWGEFSNLGRFYMVELSKNLVIDSHINPEEFMNCICTEPEYAKRFE